MHNHYQVLENQFSDALTISLNSAPSPFSSLFILQSHGSDLLKKKKNDQTVEGYNLIVNWRIQFGLIVCGEVI